MMTATTTKRFSPAGQAVPILSSPFPMPCPLVHSTIPLPASGKLGAKFRWNGRQCDRVVLTAMDDDSPVRQHSTIQPNDTVVAVNHVAALKSSQVGQLIRLSHDSVTLTTLPHPTHLQHPVLPPFTKVTVAPLLVQQQNHHHQPPPPLHVDSTRGRCLVRVSRTWGLDDTAVAEGDVLLSIQGIPVTTPAAVDRILLYGNDNEDDDIDDDTPPLSSSSSFVWLYTVDIRSYRTSVAWELQSAFPSVVWKEETNDNNRSSSGSSIVATLSIGHHHADTKHRIPLEVDRETLHVHIAQNNNKQIRHAKLIHRYLQALNQGMEDRMRLLETLVCGEAYAYNRRRLDERRRQRRRCTKSQEPEDLSAMTTTSMGSSTPTNSSSSSSSRSECSKATACTVQSSSSSSSSDPEEEDEETVVSVPAALVLPIAALQTCQEREILAETMTGA